MHYQKGARGPNFGEQPPVSNEQQRYVTERQSCWAEISKLSDYIQRYAITEYSQLELTREKYFDLYNIAIHLLRAIESLDPERARRRKQYYVSQHEHMGQPMINPPRSSTTSPSHPLMQGEMLPHTSTFPSNPSNKRSRAVMQQQHHGQSSMMPSSKIGMGMGRIPPSYTSPPMHYSNSTGSSFPVNNTPNTGLPPLSNENMSKGVSSMGNDSAAMKMMQGGGVYFDDMHSIVDRKPKRQRRRKNVYTARRNLHCHACGVTETPEWRRGPDGDHTLCNACGLHYAKALKKEKEEREKSAQQKEEQVRNLNQDVGMILNEKFDFKNLEQAKRETDETTTEQLAQEATYGSSPKLSNGLPSVTGDVCPGD